MTQHPPDQPRNWAADIWDPSFDWDTADLVQLRDQADAAQLADGSVTQEWLDWYGEAYFDAALVCLGVLRVNETVASVMVSRRAPEAARGDETGRRCEGGHRIGRRGCTPGFKSRLAR